MITGRDQIIISSLEWDFLWQGPQEVASLLASAGNRILYIENTGIRSPRLRDTSRVISRFGRWAKARREGGLLEVAPRIHVCSPVALPPFGGPLRRAVNRALFLRRIERLARSLGIQDPVIWTFLPTDTASDLIQMFRTPRTITVYYCAADFTRLALKEAKPRARERIGATERNIVSGCDLTFVYLAEVADRFRQWSDDVYLFPYGVNLEVFPLISTSPENAVPTIGYIGGLHKHIDFDLLASVIEARPNWRWIFVGPVQVDVGALSIQPNVELLGQRPHYELIEHMRGFDVCIVPYANNEYTDTLVPVKINEYLACGKPVVATSLPDVIRFNDKHNVLFVAPAERDLFVAAIERALAAPQTDEIRQRRREIAALSSWDSRIMEMSKLIEEKVASKN